MFRPVSLAVAALVALASTTALAQGIGTVAAVNPATTGTPPAASQRVLQLTDEVVRDEVIETSDVGSAQLLFLDQTSLTVSPNSQVVLDTYAYDPAQGRGELAIDMTKGVLRLIGGRITKQADATVRTPITTIGIRGGISLTEVSDELVRIVHVAGMYTRASCPEDVSCKGPAVTVSRPNAVIEVQPGRAPKYVGIASGDEIAEIYNRLLGFGGGGSNFASLIGGYAGGGGGVQTGGDAPYLNPISTTGQSNVGVVPLVGEAASARDDIRSFALSDPRLLGGTTGDFVDVGGEGLVRGQLTWRNNADLDLHMFLPDNTEVAFFNPTVVFNNGHATAELDFDNLGGTINVPPDLRVENIVVNGDVPAGTYNFLVDNFSDNGNLLTDFTLVLTPNGGQTTETVTGTLAPGGATDRIPLVVGGSQPGS